MSNEQKLREAFEARMTDNGKWPRAVEQGRNGCYLLAQTENAWVEWQACAEALATTEPAVNRQLTSMTQSQPVTLTDDKIEQLAVDSEIVFRRQGKLLTPFLEHIDLRRNVHAFANAIIAALREKESNK